MHDGLFEFADETDRVFDALLGVSAKRPVTEREATADEIDGGVKRKQKLVTNVAGEREPLRVLHNRVQLVSVNDKQPAPIGRVVNGVLLDRNIAVRTGECADEFVMVAGDIDNRHAFARLARNFLNDVVLWLRPENSTSQLPDIDQIADDVEFVAIIIAQELQQGADIIGAGAEMPIGNPGRATAASNGHSGLVARAAAGERKLLEREEPARWRHRRALRH